jgi:hypothetical protein
MSIDAVTPLRHRMIEDMNARTASHSLAAAAGADPPIGTLTRAKWPRRSNALGHPRRNGASAIRDR